MKWIINELWHGQGTESTPFWRFSILYIQEIQTILLMALLVILPARFYAACILGVFRYLNHEVFTEAPPRLSAFLPEGAHVIFEAT